MTTWPDDAPNLPSADPTDASGPGPDAATPDALAPAAGGHQPQAAGIIPTGIVLAATPIGTISDASPRLVAALGSADVVAAEDTRRLRTLTAALGVRITGRIVAYHEHNETTRAADLVAAAASGATVVVVTDAGMPSVSDPGLRLVRAAIEAGVPVSVLPGPSAVLTALAVSGLATDRFCFEGFPPRKAAERTRVFAELAQQPRTMVFFESPHRLGATLIAMAQAFGADRQGAVCRELTKRHEQVRRGSLTELAEWAQQAEHLGECTLVIAGAASVAAEPADLDALVARVGEMTASGQRLKDAVAELAPAAGVSKKVLYDAVLAARSDRGRERHRADVGVGETEHPQ